MPEPVTPAPAPVSAAAGAGVTYANWFSYRTADFVSENRGVFRALRISRALFPGMPLCFVGDSGLDDQKIFAQVDPVDGQFISASSMRIDW